MFDRIKGILGQSPTSKLETFICKIDTKAAQRAYDSAVEPNDAVARAVGALVLMMAGKLCDSIREFLNATPKAFKTNPAPAYDVIAFEAAAYCYSFLMGEYLRAEDEDSDDSDESPDDSYFGCLRLSMHMTSTLLKGYVNFQLSAEDFFINRVISYGIPGRSVRQDAEKLGFLIMASREGRPATRIGSDLGDVSQVGVHAAIATWHNTMLEAMAESSRRVYEFSGLADSE